MAVGRESAAQVFPFALVAIETPGLDEFGDREFIGKFHWLRLAQSTIGYSMIPKGGYRFSDKRRSQESSTGRVASTEGRAAKTACQMARRRWSLRQSCSANRKSR